MNHSYEADRDCNDGNGVRDDAEEWLKNHTASPIVT